MGAMVALLRGLGADTLCRLQQFIWIAGLYLFVMLVTLGHIFRYYGTVRPRHSGYVLLAPAWWIMTKGVTGTLHAMSNAIQENFVLWAVGFVAAGHYLARTDHCASLLSCSATAAKAAFISVPSVALVYWGYVWGTT